MTGRWRAYGRLDTWQSQAESESCLNVSSMCSDNETNSKKPKIFQKSPLQDAKESPQSSRDTYRKRKHSNDLNIDKESEGEISNKSQNSEYHEEKPEHGSRILGNNVIVGDKTLMESNSSIENISKEGLHHHLNKREYPKRGFTEELKKEILDLHNLYRGNVTPSAANMAFMEWDEELEHLAQIWADYCKFKHGTPPGSRYSRGDYGQNLYEGSDPSGSFATYLWYEEHKYYDMKTRYCKPNEQCGHYIQVAWATSNRLGCGITKCEDLYLIVCHYHSGCKASGWTLGNSITLKYERYQLQSRDEVRQNVVMELNTIPKAAFLMWKEAERVTRGVL
ncbi:peptidase inhibitor 16 [Trichonephila clavipes]|nr:peptidase inhibitor 16 [Trichonephila clavipes]